MLDEWMKSPTIKAGSLDEIQWVIAELGIASPGSRQIAALLRGAGWTQYNDGRKRMWVAPGIDPWAAGLRKSGDPRLRALQAVQEVFRGTDERVTVPELQEQAARLMGPDLADLGLINDAAGRCKDWILDRSETPRFWRRAGHKEPKYK